MVKIAAAVAIALFSCASFAGGWADFIGGAANASSEILDDKIKNDLYFKQEKALMLQRHELEMERMKLEYELQARRQKQEATQQAYSGPGPRQSESFEAWEKRQPEHIRALSKSPRPEDATWLTHLYRRDQK